MNIPQDIMDIHALMKAAGKQLYVVGGSVRDHLMGANIKDYDMATDAMPDDITKILKDKYSLNFTGKSFGVIRVYTRDCPVGYEIATFREDITLGRQPEVRLGATIEEDVRRRDFTINALFYDIDKGEIIDLVGGIDDINNKVIRCVGDPFLRFKEDKLRLMRGVRFANTFGFTIDNSTWSAILQDNKLIGPDKDGNMVSIPRDRINEEFLKSMERSKSQVAYVRMLQDAGMLQQVLPGCSLPTLWAEFNSVPELIIAMMYREHEDKDIRPFLMDVLKMSGDIAKRVELLLYADKYSRKSGDVSSGAYLIAERKAALSFSNYDMNMFLEYRLQEDMLERRAKATAISAYSIETTGKMLMDEGMEPGEAIGVEIRRREAIRFNESLEFTINMLRKQQ